MRKFSRELVYLSLGRLVIISGMLAVGAYSLAEIISDFANQWWWMVLALTYSLTVGEMFCHRVMAHRIFTVDTQSWIYKIFCWLGSVDFAWGPARSSALWHHAHHYYSDQGPHDNLNWRYHWYSSASLLPFPQLHDPTPPNLESYVHQQLKRHPDTLNDPWTLWCEEHSIFISVVTIATLWVIAPVVLINILCLGRLLLIGVALSGIAGHIKNFPLSYRNYDTPDTTSNSLILHYLFLGLGAGILQNNHHGNPCEMYPHRRWFEVDTLYPITLICKYFMEKKTVQHAQF